MVFARKCMIRFDLLVNYHSDLQSVLRKPHTIVPSPRSAGSIVREIIYQFQGSSPSVEKIPMAMAQRCINDFSSPSSANIKTGPETNVRDGNFELKPALINKVQQSPFCGTASEDANAHLQHFLEICSTFTIQGVPHDAVDLHLFPFSILGKAKQWFYAGKEVVSTWEKCSNAFLAKFYPLGKTNAL
jgi:hypothetical protein